MDNLVKQEFGFAKGMVDRRRKMVEGLGAVTSAREARANHTDILGAVREVRKHRANIMNAVDDKTAKYAIEVDELLALVQNWRERSQVELSRWGVSESEVKNMEQQILGGSL